MVCISCCGGAGGGGSATRVPARVHLPRSSRPAGCPEGGERPSAWTSILTLSLPRPLSALPPAGSATLHHWQQLAQPHLGGILDPRPGVVTKGFRTLDVDVDEVYCLNDFEEDDTGDHISPRGLATSTPVQRPETSGERSRARVTVSGGRSYPSRPQAFPEEMQEPPAAAEAEAEAEEGSGEGTQLSPVSPAPAPEAELWAVLTSVPGTIRSGALSVASARPCG